MAFSGMVSVDFRRFLLCRIAGYQLDAGGRKRSHDAISVIAPLHLHGRRNVNPRFAVLAKLRSSHDIAEDFSDIRISHN